MTGIVVKDLDEKLSFGAAVEGLDFEALADENVRQQLRDLFVDRGMIVFRDVEPSARMQVALSKVFGPLKDHPTTTTPRDEETGDAAEGVIDMHYRPSDDVARGEGLVEMNGEVIARYSPWHFDHCYNDELNYAGVLRAPINAPVGGRTGFMDGIELYRQFPGDLLEKIEGKNVIYTLDTRLSTMKYGVNFTPLTEHSTTPQLLKEAARFPRAMHPAIWTRETGEKVLHYGPWMAVGLEHHEDPEGDRMLDEVAREINRRGEGTSAYWHQWKPTDMVIWDNHRMLHAVEGCDAKYERQTLRTTIKGDYGLGYFEDGKKVGEVEREIA
ncbi:TauD/TfdA dioxygenase family protein [Novosphingobium mangrovi (ex Huang et al. 2023)]|uniref:TauD/TfdA family dioxygenase n=1 Tax=Novosphingobium mangrovi (ex Huang et al. 2023) TaxID=2976432 RepID=A0ABT2I7C6_9SPHN|nr:TauD/TfdA family dioxygenase [Novosphingobium mangrovi (ex Huang et al. 2023)]MCT2400726.1 TauD/TfdA family dioxygenase [Novosphingobium mangrovi (ex Huang et al. 2023)]